MYLTLLLSDSFVSDPFHYGDVCISACKLVPNQRGSDAVKQGFFCQEGDLENGRATDTSSYHSITTLTYTQVSFLTAYNVECAYRLNMDRQKLERAYENSSLRRLCKI